MFQNCFRTVSKLFQNCFKTIFYDSFYTLCDNSFCTTFNGSSCTIFHDSFLTTFYNSFLTIVDDSFLTISLFPGAVSIERYDLRTDSWSLVDNMNGRRLQFGVAVIDEKLFLVGGRDGLKTLNTVECYDPNKKSWSPMPSMATHRHGLGA